MKKIRMIKKQVVLAIVSLLLCAVTVTGFAFSGPSKEAAAAETDDFQIELIPLEEDEGDVSIIEDTSDEDISDDTGDDEDADADTDAPDGDEQDADEPEGDEPGNEDTDPGDEQDPEEEPVCDCTAHCKKDDIDDTCPVCSVNYKNCVWIDPKVAIAIDNPTDWKTKATKIGITVVDENNSGHFFIKKVEARIGSTGSYTDITDDMYVTISENCTLYIQVTEENGTVTSKSRKFSCFDTDKPSVNAGIEGELLYVEADDATSGIYAIYVNGSKFTDLNEGKLTINLKDYDSVYEYVTIQAYDHAGNRSNSYKIKNPYYVDPEKRENKDDQSVNNPTSIQPSAPTSSKATVTEHTDKEGNTKPGVGKNPVNADVEEDEDTETVAATPNDGGKEFYTITTASDKIFYLIIDKDRSQENVYLLTEVNENDLLNFVNYNGEHVTQGELPLYTVDPEVVDANKPDAEADDVINVPEEPEVEEPEEPKKTGNNNTLILIAIIAAIGGVALYFFKKKGKKPDYDYEADADDIDTFEPVEDSSDDDDEEDILFDDDDEEDGIPADIDESVMEEEDE